MRTQGIPHFFYRTRWLFAALGMVCVVLVGLPLAFDFFLTIPWWYRKKMGQAIFWGIVGLGFVRLLTVRPSDEWPTESQTERPGPRLNRVERCLPWALQLMTATLALPMLRGADALGFGDWDHLLKLFEAIRRSILIWHQFPWWNPWARGGFPLAAEPECGAFSLATPLVLIFGTGYGLRLAAVICMMIAVEGARRLAWLWLREPWSAAIAALIYGINGGVIVYSVAGYFTAMSYCATPWMIYYACRVGGRLRDGLALGFWVAFNLTSGIQYMSIYGMLIAGLVWLRSLRVQPRHQLRQFLRHSLAALGVILTVASWRIVTTGLVMWDYPRVWSSIIQRSPLTALHWFLLRPDAKFVAGMSSPFFWESACYLGPLVVLVTLASMFQRWRWWHTLTLICFWLSLGAVEVYQPSYWLNQAPIFNSMHVITRWRITEMIGVGLCVGGFVAHWRLDGNLLQRVAAIVIVLVIAGDFLTYGHQILAVGNSIRPTEDLFPGPPTSQLVNVENGLGYAGVLRGYGVIRTHEALLGYDRNLPTARLWKGHPEYRGEAWVDGRPIEPTFWSPNQIVFQTQPHQEVHVNQNPGSWWQVNGRRPFAHWRCAEWQKPFVVQADERGRLELVIKPKGLPLGLGLHAAGLLLLAAVFATSHRRIQRPITMST